MPLPSVPLAQIDQILAAANANGADKGFWTPDRIRAATELNKRQAAYKLVAGKKTRANTMGESIMDEGYPDCTIDHRNEPAHSSKIGGNLRAQHHAPDPGKPDLNREFAQFRDLPVERVEEQADSEMNRFLDKFARRMGVAPISEDEGYTRTSAGTGRIPRQRMRWMP
jgi:hypothetical protein